MELKCLLRAFITRRSAYLIKHSFFCWKARQPCCWTDAVTSTTTTTTTASTTTTTTIATTTLHIQLQFCSHRNVNPPTQPNPTPVPASRFLQFFTNRQKVRHHVGVWMDRGGYRVRGGGDDADNPQILCRRIRHWMAHDRMKICDCLLHPTTSLVNHVISWTFLPSPLTVEGILRQKWLSFIKCKHIVRWRHLSHKK